MPELGIVGDLAAVLGAALVGGLAAFLLRQPVILGYLVAGVAIGPFGLGLIRDLTTVQSLADFGVALLMFTVGVHFSLAELRAVQRVAIFGGAFQIAATILVGIGLGLLLGWAFPEAVFFGCVIAVSSTAIVIKVLSDRGELDTLHGRIMIGILIVQDLAVIPMMVLLPLLGGSSSSSGLADLGIAILRAAVFMGAMFVLGTRLIPWVIERIVKTRSRELFLLAIMALVLGTALVTRLFDLSLALGAFVAGLVISESKFGAQALAEVIPLRDIFVLLFFVSIGMLTDPRFVLQNLGMVALAVGVIVVSKWVLSSLAAGFSCYDGRTSFMVGLGLVQIGEFSFLLARLGLDRGIISDQVYTLILASAILTILLTPLLMTTGPGMYSWLSRFRLLRPLLEVRLCPLIYGETGRLKNHAVVCGYGEVSRHAVNVLRQRNFSCLVIDLDPYVIEDLRRQGIPCIYGDASNPYVLSLAGLDRARVLLVTIPDPMAVETALSNALQINPRLDVIARTRGGARLSKAGTHGFLEIVEPEFEAGLEMMRHALHRFGVSSPEIQQLVSTLRREHTQSVRGPDRAEADGASTQEW
ncbi:MAG: cation:proton antiporter [Dehalococcoidia bacterium]|nr:cation:proton antiporter [Dehalococcoidia bacterium]